MKVYLSLIISLLLTIAHQAYSKGCSYVKIDLDIHSVKSCSYQNGVVIANLSKNYSDYNFTWTDLASNTKISTANRNYVYKLKVGDYKLTISPKDNPNCKISKEFFLHGKFISTKCYNKTVELERVEIAETNTSPPTPDKYSILTYGDTGEDLFMRINNPTEKAGPWIIVPKPSAVEKNLFEFGNIYEFASAYGYDYGLEASGGVISKAVRVNYFAKKSKLADAPIVSTDDFSISPLPANNRLNIKIQPNFDINSIEVLSLNGQTIKKQVIETGAKNIELYIDDLNSGIYLVKANSNFKTITKKVIVK